MSIIDKIKLNGTTYDVGKILDTTLTQTGQAADSKAVGDRIDEVKFDLSYIDAIVPNSMRVTETYSPSWVQGGIETDGADSTTISSGRIKTDFIPVGKECFLSATTNGTILYTIRIYDSNKEHLSNGYANDNFGTIIVSSGFTKYSIDVDSVKAVEPTAGYIRIVARKADYTALTPSDSGMTCTYKGQIDTSETLSDVFVSKKNNGKYYADEISFTYDIDISGHYTKGFLKLPPNYPNVAKVPMIVFVHGSADIMNLSATKMTTNYETYYNYLRDCGYVIFDCYGWGNRYTVNYGSTWGTPTNDLCYLNGIEYVCNNYNIDRRNIFVSCKSLGGIEAYSLCYQKVVPIRAAGLLAPELDIFGPKPFGYHRDQRVAIASDDGFTGDWQSVIDVADSSFSQDALKTYILTQDKAMQKHNPAWKNLIMAESDKFNLSLNNDYTVSGYKVTDVPIKVWVAEDDDAVSYDKIVYHMTQIRNAGGYAEVRIMPNNTGKHHSVDYDSNAPQTTNVTTPLGIEYASIPTAYYELEQFFRSFRIVA